MRQFSVYESNMIGPVYLRGRYFTLREAEVRASELVSQLKQRGNAAVVTVTSDVTGNGFLSTREIHSFAVNASNSISMF